MRNITNGRVTLKKGLNRAGATPLFGSQSAQKYVGSLPPSQALPSGAFCPSDSGDSRICQTECLTFCMNAKGEAHCRF